MNNNNIQSNYFETPIVLVVYNRAAVIRKTLEVIKEIKPSQLFIVADGPKLNDVNDKIKCNEVKSILETIDWAGEVTLIKSEYNMGIRRRIISGLNIVFNKVDSCIVLEDDCFPHLTFFKYCQNLLDYYKDNDKIMFINGTNLHGKENDTEFSYHFSIYNHVWGYALWKRTWEKFDENMKSWGKWKTEKYLNNFLIRKNIIRYWKYIFEMTYRGKIDSYDFPLLFTCWENGGLSITPNVNLVSNIGFGENATHTKNPNDNFANIPNCKMKFPMSHPFKIERDYKKDKFEEDYHYLPSLWQRIKNGIKYYITI